MQTGSATSQVEPETNTDLGVVENAVSSFFARRTDLGRVRGLRGTEPGYDRALWKEIAGLGWTGTLFPEQYGGSGLGFREMAAIVRGCARALFPEPVTASAVLAGRAILHGDNESLKQHLLSRLIAGELIPALAWQEPDGGIAVHAVGALAGEKGGSIIINGSKRFVVPALGADGFVVSARSPRGLELYWVPQGTAGLSVSLEKRADGTFCALLSLAGVAVPRANIVASSSTATIALQKAAAEATVMCCVESLAVMEKALAMTLEYLRTRVQFGRPIGSFQALQHRAVDLHIQKGLSAAAVSAALQVLDTKSDVTALMLAASRAKSRCAEAGFRIARESIQFHGAIGFSDECDIGLYLQRALVLSAWLGNAAAHRRRYAELAAPEVPVSERARAKTQSGPPPRPKRFPANGTRRPAAGVVKDWNAMSDDAFRMEIREYFENNYPDHLRYLLRRARWSETRDWYFEMSHKGWIAPNWPAEHGGMGLSPAKLLVFIEEQERIGIARSPDIGIVMLGPLLMRFGTEEQKQTYLPCILSGERIWCQGYSEPNAGSDLASLQTAAVLDGNEFVVNGQKIWTTLAHDATHMFVLARTDQAAKRKQDGISFLLLDLKTPGVTIRPIRNIEGHEEFCQVFFDNVRIPEANLVGKLHQGWTVAQALLGFERLNHGSPRRAQYPLKRVEMLARERGLLGDAEFAGKYARLRLDVADLADAYARFADLARAGKPLGAEVSMLKIWATETFQRLSELMIETAGDCGCLRGELAFGEDTIDVLSPFYASFVATIAAGSSEIQRNILARRVLGLPGERRDK
ncbi:MAG: acyl-CoA dehydrogenase [Betaproteobacteria bacterium]|nr:acyl-CoA dehydrogenase [Betaproteobacteria bacterium]